MPAAVPPDAVPRRRLETRARNYRGRLLVASSVDTLELDAAGEFIFKQIDGVVTVRQIAERVADTYHVGVAEAMADSAELIAELAAARVVQID
jgi:coenzyme PQQ synthesis protein D (PqqD)